MAAAIGVPRHGADRGPLAVEVGVPVWALLGLASTRLRWRRGKGLPVDGDDL